MAQLGDFISNISKSSGANINTDAMKAVLMHPELSKLDIPDEFVSGVMKGLLTKDVAKNDTEIRNHYYAQWAKTADSVLDESLVKFSIDPETTQAIKSQDGIYTRFQKLAEAVKDAESKKANATTGADKNKANEELVKINQEFAAFKAQAKADADKLKSDLTTEYHGKLKEGEYKRFLSEFDLAKGDPANPTPKEAQIILADFYFKKALEDKKLQLAFDADKLQFGLKTSDGMDYFENHAQISPKDLASKVLAENKLLNVSGTPTGTPNTPAQNQQTVVSTGGQKRDNSAFEAAMAEAKASLSQVH